MDPSGTTKFAVWRHCGHEELMSPNFNVLHSILVLEKNVLRKKPPQNVEIPKQI